CQQYKDLKTF
nr:immunoglobulin light chain junction region [Macaca mulatta]MOV63013.1 immunoglobulin light chain junction region [Macaca mulatta]